MTWFRVDDSFYDHPKVVNLPLSSVGAWIKAASWACKHLTDGHVSGVTLARLGIRKRHKDVLILAGLWRKNGDGIDFHDWTKYQLSAQDEKAKREKWKERKARTRQNVPRSVPVGQPRPCPPPCLTCPEPEPEPEPELKIKVPNGTSSSCGSESPKRDGRVKEVFDHWVERMSKPRARLTADRTAKIQSRLREGFSNEDLKAAIDGCAQSPFHMGANDTGQKHNDITLICRSGSHVERFRDLATGDGISGPQPPEKLPREVGDFILFKLAELLGKPGYYVARPDRSQDRWEFVEKRGPGRSPAPVTYGRILKLFEESKRGGHSDSGADKGSTEPGNGPGGTRHRLAGERASHVILAPGAN